MHYIHKSVLELYYDILGQDYIDNFPDFIEFESVDDLSPLLSMVRITSKTERLNNELLYFLDRLVCCFEGKMDDEDLALVSSEFLLSVVTILSICTNINVCTPEEYSFRTFNERLDAVLIKVLYEINSMDITDVIDLRDSIFSKSYDIILSNENLSNIPYISLLVMLGLHDNRELKDGCIFDFNNEVDLEQLSNHVRQNVLSLSETDPQEFVTFNRLTLRNSYLL